MINESGSSEIKRCSCTFCIPSFFAFRQYFLNHASFHTSISIDNQRGVGFRSNDARPAGRTFQRASEPSMSLSSSGLFLAASFLLQYNLVYNLGPGLTIGCLEGEGVV